MLKTQEQIVNSLQALDTYFFGGDYKGTTVTRMEAMGHVEALTETFRGGRVTFHAGKSSGRTDGGER